VKQKERDGGSEGEIEGGRKEELERENEPGRREECKREHLYLQSFITQCYFRD